MFEFIYLHLGTPLEEMNRNVAPKRRRIVVPPINQDPSSNLIKDPVVFGKPRVPSNCNPEECPPNKPDKEPEPEAIEDRCMYCGQGPCIATGSFRSIGARRADIRNHSFRHKDYRSYWKYLKDCGFWQCPQYLERKTAAGIPEEELREIIPVCVLKDVCNRYANPPGVPYMGHKRF